MGKTHSCKLYNVLYLDDFEDKNGLPFHYLLSCLKHSKGVGGAVRTKKDTLSLSRNFSEFRGCALLLLEHRNLFAHHAELEVSGSLMALHWACLSRLYELAELIGEQIGCEPTLSTSESGYKNMIHCLSQYGTTEAMPGYKRPLLTLGGNDPKINEAFENLKKEGIKEEGKWGPFRWTTYKPKPR